MSMIPKKANGFVYFIQDENGLVKIGISKSVADRLKQLQTGSAQRLKLLGSIEALDYKELEKDLHAKYKHSRVNGEWFDITSDEVKSVLHRYRKPGKVSLEELSNGAEEIHDLIGVQYKGAYLVPDDRYNTIAVVTSCEFDESSFYVTETTVGKGCSWHSQYEISEIPSNWIVVSEVGVSSI